MYLNFNKIVADPLVDEGTVLNDNWDQLDQKLGVLSLGGAIVSPEVGQEFIDSGRFAVWDGAATRYRDDIDAGWSALTAFPLGSLITQNSTNTPYWRVNTFLRKVQLWGQVIYNGGVAWPRGVYRTINGITIPNNIPSTYLPTGGFHRQETATAVPTTEAASAAIYVKQSTAEPLVLDIGARFLGANASAPIYVSLDGIEWWY